MDAARLNFSHGTHDDHAEGAKLVREAQKRAGRPLAVIADLQGPKLRVGELESPLVLVEGAELEVTGDDHEPGLCRSAHPSSSRCSDAGTTCSSTTGACASASRR